MKKQPYKEFIELNRWFRENSNKRKNFISKISRLANSIQKDVVQGPAQTLLSLDEQMTLKKASEILTNLKLTIDDAKKHVIYVNKYFEYQIVTIHRHKYKKMISERIPIDKDNLIDVCKATMVMIYFRTLNILSVESYVMRIEMRTTRGQVTPEELSNLLISKYIEETDRLAYKFYNKDSESIHYDELMQAINTAEQEKNDILKPYRGFFIKLSEALASQK